MKPKLVLFDLGQVLASLGSPTQQMRLAMNDQEFWSLWLSVPIVQSFERGDVAPDEFLCRLSQELKIEEDPVCFKQRFLNWHPRLFPSTEPLISSIAEDCELAILSNTNTLHWDLITSRSTVFDTFDYLFLSYEIRYCKPELGAFEAVLNTTSVSPSDILFLDDMTENILAARTLGISAVRVCGMDELIDALTASHFEISVVPAEQESDYDVAELQNLSRG